MRKVLFLLLAVSLFSGVNSALSVSMKETAVGQNQTLQIDSTKEKIEIASGSALPAHFVLYPDGKIKLDNPAGADFENPSLRKFNFKLSVKSLATGKEIRQEDVVLNILDANDVKPRFVGPLPATLAYPNRLPGSQNFTGLFYKEAKTLDGAFIYCLTSRDPDTTAKLAYSFSPVDKTDLDQYKRYFKVVNVGCLVRKGNTDMPGAPTKWRIPIRVTDLNSELPDQASSDVFVEANVPFQPPQIAAKPFFIDFYEGSALGPIGQIYAVQMQSRYNRMEYTVTKPDAGKLGFPFVVDKNTGVVSLTNNLHTGVYDRVCRQEWHAIINVKEFGATQKESSTLLILRLLDKNDLAPFFDNKIYFARIPEDLATTKLVTTINVNDPDSTSNKDLVYTLEGADRAYFTVKKLGTPPYFPIAVYPSGNPKLDFEDKSRLDHLYKVTLVATDTVHPVVRADLVIEVTNANDESPFPTTETITVNLNRDSVGSIVYQVAMNDPDGSTVTYAFKVAGGTTTTTDNRFQIDANTGIVTYKTKESNFNIAEVVLEITGTDGGDCSPACIPTPPTPTKRPSTKNVRLTVKYVDANKFTPTFTACPSKLEVPENENIGHSVTTLPATDKDSGKNGQILYELIGNAFTPNPTYYFSINATTGEITTKITFDRENYDANYWAVWISVRASDSGGGTNPQARRASVCTMHLEIKDKNDNSPKFLVEQLEVFMKAKTYSVGDVVTTIYAHDNDLVNTTNSNIDYTLVGSPPGFLQIGQQTGIVTFSASQTLTMTNRIHTFKVLAADQGAPKRSATATVEIIVTDNDAELPPVVTFDRSIKRMPENAQDLTTLVSITATQPGGSTFNMYDLPGSTVTTNRGLSSFVKKGSGNTYVVQKNGAFNAARIDHVYYSAKFENNKKITVNGKLRNIYVLVNVFVLIEDVNNKVPQFITLTPLRAQIVVIENNVYSSTSPIAFLFAADKDKLLNNRKVVMELKQTNDFKYFQVTSNQLIANAAELASSMFDYEKKKTYLVDLVAKDSAPSSDPSTGGKPNEQPITLTVVVTDVNDEQPVFDKTTYYARVSENAAIGYVFFTMNATDKDDVSKTSLYYNLRSVGTPFGIHADKGTLFVGKHLNSEVKSSYLLDVSVFDGNFSASTKVNVTVTNVDDEKPKFDKDTYTLPTFTAGTIPTTPWSTFTVSDPDSSDPAKATGVQVTAVGKWTEDPTAYFGITFVSGITWRFDVKSTVMQPWKTTETLDRHYRFMLKATKQVGTTTKRTLTTYATVSVKVSKPTSTDSLCFKPGTLLGWPLVGDQTALTLSAVNPDDPSGAASLTYSVADANYEINSKTKVNFKAGTTATGPDTIKSFMVTAKEASPSTKNVTARAFVMVQPKSTNNPSCRTQRVTIYDNTKPKAVFFALLITDVDAADRGKLSFSTSPSNHAFLDFTLLPGIDAVGFSLKGSVSVGTVVDKVDMTVRDTQSLTGTCTITFVVAYGNAGALTMTLTPPTVSVPENDAVVPKKLTTVTVSDPKAARSFVISMEIANNPGLELRRTSLNTAELYATAQFNREALTTGANDATVPVTIVGTPMDAGGSTPVKKQFVLTVTDVNEPPTVTPLTAAVDMTKSPQDVVPAFTATDGDKKVNQGAYTVAIKPGDPSIAVMGVARTATGFKLTTKKNADLSKFSSPLFVPVQITENSKTRTVTIKIDLTDNKLTNTDKTISVIASSGWFWYFQPSVVDFNLGSVYGKTLMPETMKLLSYNIPSPKFPSYFELNKTSGNLLFKGGVPAGNYTEVAEVKLGTQTVTATVRVQVRIASNQAVQHAVTARINGIDAKHFVLRPKKVGLTGSSSKDFDESLLTKFADIIAKKLSTTRDKVLILSARDFRDNNGAPYIEVLYAASGSPYYTPSKLSIISAQAQPDIQAVLPNGVILVTPIDKCSTAGATCPYGCVNRIRVDEKDKDVTVNPSASFVGLKVNVQAVCGCEFKPNYAPPDCSINACLNDGKCSLPPGSVNARCECPKNLGLTGPRCQKLDVNFNTRKGYVMTESLGSCSDLHVSFEFISTATPSNEILLYDGPYVDGRTDDYFLVGLENKKPYIEISGKKGLTPRKKVVDFQVAANTWYRLDIFYKHNGSPGDYMEILLDRCFSVSNTHVDGVTAPDRTKCSGYEALPSSDFALDRRIDVAAYPLQVGGSNLKKYSNRGLVGSIRRVRVNSKLRNLLVASQGLSANADDNKALAATCTGSDGKPKCGAQAVCRPHPTTPTCTCLPGYRKDNTGACSVATKVMDFQNNSFTFWKLKPTVPKDRRRTWASIRFRTRQTAGTLLYFTSADGYRNQSIEVRLQNSRVQAVFNLGDYSFKPIILPNTNVSDGDWHTIDINRVLNDFELILDNGEYGNYYYYRNGRAVPYNYLTMSDQILNGLRWKRKYSDLKVIEYFFSDINNTCMTDVRYDEQWIPMLAADQVAAEAKANVELQQNRKDGCANPNLCTSTTTCPAPYVCVPQIWRPLTTPPCGCAVGTVAVPIGGKMSCMAMGVCFPNPCRAGTCHLSTTDSRGYTCVCLKGYAGKNCEVALVSTASLGAGLIALIVIVLLLIIVAILIYLFCVKCRRRDEKLLADPDDYTRENITPYDEEGAGEEDHDHYDLTYLRKPVTDIRPVKSVPLSSAPPHRPPDLGNFLDGRLLDAENDPHGPPQDYSLDYGYEGQGSVVDDLSSLGSGTSDGSQQYDHLHNLGPKFRPLHDLYNHQRNV